MGNVCCLSVVTETRLVLNWSESTFETACVKSACIRYRGNVLSNLLPSNGGPTTVDFVTSELCLPNRCLVMVIFRAMI
jgi:hypothetical protein